MKKVLVLMTSFVLPIVAIACVSADKETRKDSKPAAQTAPAPQKDTRTAAEIQEDLSYREIITKEFKYVEGIKEDAQDSFGQGVLFLHQFPPNYERAVESFRNAIDKDATFPEAYFNLGQIYERQGKPMDAIRIYEAAGQKTDAKLDSQAYVGKVYLGLAKKARDTGMVTEADSYETKAKAIFDEIISQDSENLQANNSLALYWLFKGDTKTAEDFVRKVLLKAPQDVVALNTRGLINLKAGNLKIAKWVFEQKALRFDPNSIEALTNLGITYLRMGDTPMGVTSFEKALQIDPNNYEARMNVAAIYLNYLHYDAARAQYEAALELVPDSSEGMIGLGSCYLGLLDAEKAVASWDKAIKVTPSLPELYLRVAKVYETRLNNLDKAIEYYEKYLEVANPPDNDPIRGRIPVLKEMAKNGGMLMPMDEPAPEVPAEAVPEAVPAEAVQPAAEPVVEPAPEAAPAVEEPAPAVEPAPEAAPVVEEAAPAVEPAPVVEPAVEVAPVVEEPAPAVEVAPVVEEPSPSPEAPAEQGAPAVEPAPVVEPAPAVEVAPAVEPAAEPAAQPAPAPVAEATEEVVEAASPSPEAPAEQGAPVVDAAVDAAAPVVEEAAPVAE